MWRLGVLSLLFFIILMEDKIDYNLKIGGGLVFLNWDLVIVWLGNLIKFIFNNSVDLFKWVGYL